MRGPQNHIFVFEEWLQEATVGSLFCWRRANYRKNHNYRKPSAREREDTWLANNKKKYVFFHIGTWCEALVYGMQRGATPAYYFLHIRTLPALFCTLSLDDIISHGFQYRCCTDKTQLYRSTPTLLTTIQSCTSAYLYDTSAWMAHHTQSML